MLKLRKSSFLFPPDSIYCFDKAYVSYKWLHTIHKSKAFFVTRAKINMDYQVIGQHSEGGKKSILSDQLIKLNAEASAKKYPSKMRLIIFKDKESGKVYHLITNNFRLAASTIAAIYKQRWQIEIFFKWIKQNLKIKRSSAPQKMQLWHRSGWQ